MACDYCLADCFRFILFILNTIFVLSGLAFMVVGIASHVYFTHYEDAVPSDAKVLSKFPIITGVGGAIIFLIALIGCCGACRKSVCCLMTYGIIMMILFLAQAAIAIISFIKIKDKKGLHEQIKKHFTDTFDKYFEKKQCQETTDMLQKSFHCCGLESPKYWNNRIPESCYPNGDTKKTLYQDGCIKTFYDWILDSMVGTYILIGIGVVELVAGIIAIWAACSYKDDGDDDDDDADDEFVE